MEVLSEFLENPLLVSLLYKTFEYKEEIPYKKIDFYEQVYAALFNDHDKTKGSAYVHEKKTKLDKYQFEQILRTFGFLCLKTDKVEYSSRLIYHLLGQAVDRFRWLKVNTSDFLDDIIQAVPFIQKDGNEYKWVHKSFMEYFASCFICYENKEYEQKNLYKIVFSGYRKKYCNVINFCYEMDTLNFRKYIISPYLKKYISGYENYFQNEFFNNYDEKSLKIAKQLLALEVKIWVLNNADLDEVCDLDVKLEEKLDFSQFKEINNQIKIALDKVVNSIKVDHDISKSAIFHVHKDCSVYICCNTNSSLYSLLIEKIPSIFETIHLEMKGCEAIQRNTKVKFDDNINNPINMNKERFNIVVNNIFCNLFREEMILDLKKCKKLVEEIDMEENFLSKDIFEL